MRQEVACQIQDMQKGNIIQPSRSPWASPVVLVRKRDGTHRLCVDYRRLNAVAKPDTFPLPRIDDLLDLLGGAKYFDLAAGFWQILDFDLANGSVRGTGPSCMTDSCMTDSCMTWRPSLTINSHPVAKQLGSIMEIGLIFMQELP